MGKLTLLALRIVLAMVLTGSLFVQVVMVPLFWQDLDEAPAGVRIPVVAIVVLGIVSVQVTAVCVWKLLTMVRRGTVFSDAAFRFVDLIFLAVAFASALAFTLGVVLAPGEDVAPGRGTPDRRSGGVHRRRRSDRAGAPHAAGPGRRPRGTRPAAPVRARRGHLMGHLMGVI